MEFPNENELFDSELPKVALENPEINDSIKLISIVSKTKWWNIKNVIFPIPNVLFENLKILYLEKSSIHLKDFQTILKRCTQLESLTYISQAWIYRDDFRSFDVSDKVVFDVRELKRLNELVLMF